MGLPGYGKTRYVREHFQDRCRIVSIDRHLDAVAKANELSREHAWHQYYEQAQEATRQDFLSALAAREDLVLDRMNHTVRGRKWWLDQARRHSYRVEALVFELPWPTLLERNRRRGPQSVKREALKKFFKEFKPPYNDEVDAVTRPTLSSVSNPVTHQPGDIAYPDIPATAVEERCLTTDEFEDDVPRPYNPRVRGPVPPLSRWWWLWWLFATIMGMALFLTRRGWIRRRGIE